MAGQSVGEKTAQRHCSGVVLLFVVENLIRVMPFLVLMLVLLLPRGRVKGRLHDATLSPRIIRSLMPMVLLGCVHRVQFGMIRRQ